MGIHMIKNANHTQVSNDFLDNYMSTLSGAETKVFLVVTRKTTGFHKLTDSISISQIMKFTGLSNRKVIDSIKSLEQKGLVIVDREKVENKHNKINKYTICYEHNSQGVVNKLHKGCEQKDTRGSEQTSYTKDNTTKDTFTKESMQADKSAIRKELNAMFIKGQEETNTIVTKHAKEGRNLNNLLESLTKFKTSLTTEELSLKFMRCFYDKIKHGKNDFWRNMQFTPSMAYSNFDIIMTDINKQQIATKEAENIDIEGVFG